MKGFKDQQILETPSTRADITGVVLAGGRGRRMGGEDKGLLPFRGKPLVCHALAILNAVAGDVFINANRNLGAYADLGHRVVPDLNGHFDGPLAGLLSVMRAAKTPYVLTVPCDAPLLDARLLARLVAGMAHRDAMAVAHDGERLHPVIMLVETRLAADLETYLAGGQRQVEAWIRRHPWTRVDFSDCPDSFVNINTREDLASLDASPCGKILKNHRDCPDDEGRARCREESYFRYISTVARPSAIMDSRYPFNQRHSPMETRPPLPPFSLETAIQKVRLAEDGWNSRDPERVALVYTPDSEWRNRVEFPKGREQIIEFLTRKWRRELDYRLIKELWAYDSHRIAVRFAYEWHDDAGHWFRAYGNENWEFDDNGLMRRRYASINDLPIRDGERLFHWPLGRRPDDHPGLSDLGL